MNMMSLSFAAFFGLLLMLLHRIKKPDAQQLLLLGASYLFYGLFDLRFLLLLILMSLAVWYLGRAIGARKAAGQSASFSLVLGLCLTLGVLGIFKYLGFFVGSFSAAFGLDIGTLRLLLPVGISFYTFQAISYLCDIHSGKIQPAKLIHVLLYIGFFPQIVSGPIVKVHEFLPQLEKPVQLTGEDLSEGIQRFGVGLFKKLVIADRLGVCVNAVFRAPAAYSGMSILWAVLAYSMQIYCDFSGYSDMAVGVGRCLGFDLGRNFNLPYLAQNPSDFWRRWHISLSSWFRDYLFIPLGGSRGGTWRTCRNLFLTMLLSGLWHGASWTFVLWGALHGLWSVAQRLLRRQRKKTAFGAIQTVKRTLCFGGVSLLWVVFRADSLETLGILLYRLFTMAEGIRYYFVFVPIFGAVLLGVNLYAARKTGGNDPFQPLNPQKFGSKLILCGFYMLTFLLAYFGDSAFLYAQF